jgi:hypothetical protein
MNEYCPTCNEPVELRQAHLSRDGYVTYARLCWACRTLDYTERTSTQGTYTLLAVKRTRIPEWLASAIIRSFLRPLCLRQPLRWVLFHTLPTL